MATIAELGKAKAVVTMGGNLQSHEVPMRTLYASDHAVEWMRLNLPYLESDGYVEGALTPLQQATDITHAYVVGDDFEHEMVPHLMNPKELGVWELRTPDLRFFGWFVSKCVFVISDVETKANCVDKSLYQKYLERCRTFRDSLDLDEPKYVTGDLSNVL